MNNYGFCGTTNRPFTEGSLYQLGCIYVYISNVGSKVCPVLKVILNWPVIIKEKLPLNDEFWTDAHGINARLKEECFLCKTEAEYLYFAEILEKIEGHCGISFCEEMVNRDIHNKKSANTMLKEITEQHIQPIISEKIQELKEKLGYDEESGVI